MNVNNYNQNNKLNNNKMNNNKLNNNQLNNNKLNIIKIPQNNFFKLDNGENDIDEIKKNAKEVMQHFASYAFIKTEIKLPDFINSAVILSSLIKKINISEEKKTHINFIILKKYYNIRV